VEYAEAISKALGDRVKNWITHNEPAVVAWIGNDTGEHAPGFKDLSKGVAVSHHLLLSHGWAVPIIRRNSPKSDVGITLNVGWRVPASNSAADLNAAREGDGKWTRWFTDPIYGRGYPADVVSDFERQDAMPHQMSFVKNGDRPRKTGPRWIGKIIRKGLPVCSPVCISITNR
jgi:beta-glucosidase